MEARSSLETIKTIDEALHVLDSAASESASEIKESIAKDYKNLKRVFLEKAPEVKAGVREIGNQSLELLQKARERAVDTTVETARAIDVSAHENAWYYIGGAAAVGMVLGFIIGRKS